MDFNIDLIIAGCNTNCRHCYVNGGPGRQMPKADFELCIDKLLPVFSHFDGSISFTIDNELYGHPDALDLLRFVKEKCWPYYSHHGSTTGIAFNHRSDKEELWRFQQENGIGFGCITLHGAEKNHNLITQNPNSFKESLEYASFVKAHRGKLYVALMLTSLLVEDRDEITELLRELAPDETYFAVPLFAPSRRMIDYQAYRAAYDECMKLKGYLRKWNVDESKYLSVFETYNSESILKRMAGKKSFVLEKMPDSCFLTIHQNLDLFYGNTGAEIAKIGNMNVLTPQDVINYMETCGSNYSYFSNNFSEMPDYEKFMEYLKRNVDKDYVYPDEDSFLSYHSANYSGQFCR